MSKKIKKVLIKIIPVKKIRKKLRDDMKAKEGDISLLPKGLKNLLASKENNFTHTKDEITIDGVKFKTGGGAYGIAEIFGRKDYEFASPKKEYIFIDVGANIGDSALYAASRKNISKVYAFEPFPQTFKIAEKNIELNPDLKKKIDLFNYGWSDEDKTSRTQGVARTTDSAVNTTEKFFTEKNTVARTEEFEIILKKSSSTLRKILESTKKPIILKMDVEGAEYKSIADLVKHDMLKHIDIVFIEWHYKGYKQITDALEKAGFVWFNEKFEPEVGFIRAVNIKKA